MSGSTCYDCNDSPCTCSTIITPENNPRLCYGVLSDAYKELEKENAELKQRWEDFGAWIDVEKYSYGRKGISLSEIKKKMEELSKEKD